MKSVSIAIATVFVPPDVPDAQSVVPEIFAQEKLDMSTIISQAYSEGFIVAHGIAADATIELIMSCESGTINMDPSLHGESSNLIKSVLARPMAVKHFVAAPKRMSIL